MHVSRPYSQTTVESALDKLGRFITVAAVVVVGLGVLREVIVLGYGTTTFLQEGRHFDLNEEANLPSWFSSTLMILIAMSSAAIYLVNSVSGHGRERAWLAIAAVFLLLSLDEVASFHEAIMGPLRDSLGSSGPLFYAWIVVAIPLVAIFAIASYRFLRRTQRSLAVASVLAGFIYCSGAIGMEMVAGALISSGGSDADLAYRLEVVAEETLEITGLTLFLIAILAHARRIGFSIHSRAGAEKHQPPEPEMMPVPKTNA